MRTAGFAVLIPVLLPGAAEIGVGTRAAALSCHGARQPKEIAELAFGRDVGDHGGVSEAGWARFVVRETTPRFPDHLTITDPIGQWRDRDRGRILHERAKRVEIVVAGNADDDARLDAIVAAYKRRFRQQAVAAVRPACVLFWRGCARSAFGGCAPPALFLASNKRRDDSTGAAANEREGG